MLGTAGTITSTFTCCCAKAQAPHPRAALTTRTPTRIALCRRISHPLPFLRNRTFAPRPHSPGERDALAFDIPTGAVRDLAAKPVPSNLLVKNGLSSGCTHLVGWERRA